jgi:hypothetical protein
MRIMTNWVRSVISTSLADVEFPEKVVSVVNYLQEKRVLEFDWHQVARKIWTVGQGFGRNHGLDQHRETASVGVSSADSQNWTT